MDNTVSKKIRVLIADDHQVVREGLTSILESKGDIAVVGLAADGSEAVEKARALSPDVVLMDISMPKMNGVEATRQIKKENPQIGVVILTMFADEEYIFDLVRAGAAGYLLKDADSGQIAKAIKSVSRGESMIHPTIAAKILSEFTNLSGKGGAREKVEHAEDALSEREVTVLKLMAEGQSNKEIANGLELSDKTVKNHIHHIFQKLKVTDRTKAVIVAVRKGLIDLE